MERLRSTISASRLNCWLQCRLKFWFRYVQRLVKPPTPALHSGSVTHAVLQHWNLARWRREPFRIEQYQALFDLHWAGLQEDTAIAWEGEETEERTSTWRALEHYFIETPIKAEEKPAAVEVRVEADLSSHGLMTLVGILDLVRSGGRIVDFKTTGKTPDPALAAHQHEVQLACYGVLYRDATGQRERGFELHHLVRTKAPKFVLTSLEPMREAQHTRLLRLLESYQAGLAREDFVPAPGFHCAGCGYFAECRLWN
jgi:putative RecB family exonuclease